MMRRQVRVLIAAAMIAGALLFPAGPAVADQAYHTERLTLAPVAAGESGFGMVVNIHTNGPVNGALERYQLVHAQPDTDYTVWLVVDGGDFMATTTIHTDARGNGHGSASFSADDLAPFSGAVLPVQWVLRTGAGDAYATDTTIVTID